jgi:hypothetical protein
VPTSSSNCEKIHVIVDVAQYVDGGVVLEKEVHFNTNPSNILEHVGELHVIWVRSKPIKADVG